MEKHEHNHTGNCHHPYEQNPLLDFDISGIPTRKLEPIPLSYYQHNRQRLMDSIRKQVGPAWKEKSIAIFRGHVEHVKHQEEDIVTDSQPEWNFFYLFGFKGLYECYAVMDFRTGETTIAIPRKDQVDQIFEGGLTTDSDPKEHGVDRYIYVDELQKFVEEIDPAEIFILYGKIRDDISHYASFPWLDNHPKYLQF